VRHFSRAWFEVQSCNKVSGRKLLAATAFIGPGRVHKLDRRPAPQQDQRDWSISVESVCILLYCDGHTNS
jgi:hypothetical protein